MTQAFVADASVAVAWVHPAQATPHTAAMLDAIAEGATLEVPALWPLEVANALLVLVRRRKLAEAERQAGLRHQTPSDMAALWTISRTGRRHPPSALGRSSTGRFL